MKKAIVALALMALAVSGLAAEKPSGKDQPVSRDAEILLIGKFFCSIKRRVPMPFKGVITSVQVRAGQVVEKGEVLAAYDLSPEDRLKINQFLASPKLKDSETKLSEVQKKLEDLETQKKRQVLLLLAQQQLAQQQSAPKQAVQQQLVSPLSLLQTDQEVKQLGKEKVTLLETVKHEKQLAQEELDLLRLQLGISLNRGQLAAEARLRAPISGYVVWIHPDLHVNAELDPAKSVLQIGVMDPMLIRSRVFESEAMQLTPGDEAEVAVPSIPGRKFKAQVSRVAWSIAGVTMDEPSYYDIEFRVANPDLVLKEGLKCTIIMRKPKS